MSYCCDAARRAHTQRTCATSALLERWIRMNKSRFHQILMLVSSLYKSQTWARLLKPGCFDATRGEKALVAWADCKTSVGMGGTRCFGPSESVFSCDKCVVTVSRLAAPGFGGFGGLHWWLWWLAGFTSYLYTGVFGDGVPSTGTRLMLVVRASAAGINAAMPACICSQ
jgi:hypothetical protein